MNLALGKPATQVNDYVLDNGVRTTGAYLAVDGNRKNNDWTICTGTFMGIETVPYRWWRVDLLDFYFIERFTITNRGDCCGNYSTIYGESISFSLSVFSFVCVSVFPIFSVR